MLSDKPMVGRADYAFEGNSKRDGKHVTCKYYGSTSTVLRKITKKLSQYSSYPHEDSNLSTFCIIASDVTTFNL